MLNLKSIPLSLLFFSLLLQAVISADPLYHYCFGQENYTASSSYLANLNNLLNTLSTKTPPTGFGLDSSGLGQNRVHGLAQCRGDVSRTNCKTCVIEASKELRKRCPKQKCAIIWYDNCLLKHSNIEFFGIIDNRNKVYMYNVNEVDNPRQFNRKVKELLSRLSIKAYASPKLYAAGEMQIGASKNKLYGLVQCTRDLSDSDCKKWLDGAMNELPSWCDGKRGGRVIGGSCNFRYELYPFVNA